MLNMILLSTAEAVKQAGGYTISIVGYIIVFIALMLLVAIFTFIPKILHWIMASKKDKATGEVVEPTPVSQSMDAQTNAAIAAAIYLYFEERHDTESNIITIRTAKKEYSPWNSKIYGVSNQPVRKR